MTGYSFKAFDPATGVATAFLPDISIAQCSLEFSDVGSLKLDYPMLGRNFAALNTNRVEVGVFYNGVEINDGRFTMDSNQVDEVDFTGIASFNGRSLLNLLDYCLVYPLSGTTVATAQSFAGQTPGAILRAFFNQNSTRGGQMSIITWASLSNTTDSNGVAWATTIGNIEYKVGTSYLDIVRNMVDNGLIEVRMVGRDLRVYNANTMGVDRTTQNPPIVLRKGRDLLEAPTTSTSEQVAGVALIEGDEALLVENSNSTVNAAWGRRETYISQGGISDSSTLGVLSAQELSRRSAIRREKTRKIDVKASGWEPNVDYAVSDYVYSDTNGVNERLRIRQLVIEIDNNNIKSASVVLNDKFLEQEIAIARKVAGILGGATSAGSIGIPMQPVPEPGADTTIPSQVTGLSWSSAAYQAPSGEIRAQITASWTAVTTNTNATTIDDLDHYELQVKRNSSADWANEGLTIVDGSPAYISVPPNVTMDVRVRAIDFNGNKGAWSATSTGATAGDTTAPPTPSTPTVSPYLGQLRLYWNGLGSASEAMPTDFRYVEVHMSTTTGFTPSSATMIDQLSAAGYTTQTDLTYGTTYYFKLKAVDRTGNASAASAQASAVPETVTGLDIAALTIATSNMADLAISTAKIADAAIINAKIANLAVDDAKIGSMSVGKLTAGTLSADMTVSARIKTANTGARVEINSTGFQAYNASNVNTVAIASSDGSALITGAFRTGITGARLEMTDSTDRTTVSMYGTYGGDAAFFNSPVDGSGSPRWGLNSGSFTYAGTSTVKHRFFLNNAGGIQIESYAPGNLIVGSQIFMYSTGTNINLLDGAGGQLGAQLHLSTTSSSLQHWINDTSQTGGSLSIASTGFTLSRNGSGTPNGGYVAGDGSFIRLQVYSAGVMKGEVSVQNDGTIYTAGRFLNNQSFSNGADDAIIAGSASGGVGPQTAFSVTYGATSPARPGVVYSLFTSTNTNHRLSAFSTTGFTVTTSVSITGNMCYWAYRQ